MGEVIDFTNGKVLDAMRLAIRDSYLRTGAAIQSVDTLSIPVAEWRKIARSVGRELGRGVQTLVLGNDIHALLRDWPRDDRERAIHEGSMRSFVAAASLEKR